MLETSQSNKYTFEKIDVVRAESIAAYRALRLRGLRDHPESFGETASDFEAKTDQQIAERLRGGEQNGGFVLVAISKTGEMLGVVGLALHDPGKTRHRGMLWGMYVVPECREQKVGQRLVGELLFRAESIADLEQVHLAVVTSNRAALALYEKMGFVTYGTDPRVIKVGDTTYDEYLMVKRLGATVAS